MLHIYRQITGLRQVQSIVIAQKRENESSFPFRPVYMVAKPPTHVFRRFWFRQLLQRPWQISHGELASIQRILDKSGARLLHVYFGHIAVHLLPVIRAWGGPSVVSFHGADVLVELDKPAFRRTTEEMLSAVERIFVRSESLRTAVLRLTNDRHKISIVRTGIPLDQFTFVSRDVPQAGAWQLLHVGRLVEKKGADTAIRAFSDYVKVFPAARLLIAGEGPLLSKLQELTRQLKIAHQVSFLGFVSQEALRDLYYRSHIFLHPSQLGTDGNQEGVPNSMLEAMATGLPVFATRHGGIPEAVEDGVSGILVAERDHAALAVKLIDAAQSPPRLSQVGLAGAESVARKFEQRAQIEKLEQLYLQTMQEHG